jgi:GT2 family glycosyltransferase
MVASIAVMTDVSVAIVHYETPELLARCLRSLRTSEGVTLEVFVLDNASKRFSASDCRDAYPTATVIRNATNVGFAAASNQALRMANGRYVLLLNPDAWVEPGSLKLMVDYLDLHPDVGSATCRVQLEDGRLDVACRRLFPTPARSLYRITLLSKIFPRSRRFGQYNLTYCDEWQETEIDQPCGAFMMVRFEILDEVGLLDERYFMYGEDTDWAYRIKQAGWRIVYVPITSINHTKRASSRQDRAAAIRHFHRAMRIFYRDHYEPIYPWPVNLSVLTAIAVRERIELATDGVARHARRIRAAVRQLRQSTWRPARPL